MLFNSLAYLLFLPFTAVIYYCLPHRFRWIFLLAASYVFYMAWRPELITLLLFSTFVNYYAARHIYRSQDPAARKRTLSLCLWISFGLLFVFKYLSFFSQSLRALAGWARLPYPVPDFNLILPMGISFYTFQTASYAIDVYKGAYPAEENFWKVSLFTTFFPQLVAGPIERANTLMNQLFQDKKPKQENFILGGKYLLLGFFKKAVIADRLSIPVNAVFNTPQYYPGLPSIIAVFFFAFQIYCDFSGYSDIAVGSAKLLGVDLTQNFRQPYFSAGIRAFWRRWHVSLSSWLKDYIYIPLGGSRVPSLRHAVNRMSAFLISGLWHGADWTFVLWGGLHGFYQIIEDHVGKNVASPKRRASQNFLVSGFQRCVTFGLVCFAWIFFRANSLGDAFTIIRHLPSGLGQWHNRQYLYEVLTGMKVNLADILIDTGLIFILLLIDGTDAFAKMERAPACLRIGFYAVLAVLIMAFGVYYNAGQFIYFQF
ncbi:MAG: MBOAT family protein [Clostridiales bacterium]|jgi:D-alanyl-lipoteichoic acid acyltransferase DltB (MBOAT superfamily)|nr:MBOAT family protein [Clostridiales bacterium]